jgi:glycosyltransferase involved in cell wall biosynthesis
MNRPARILLISDAPAFGGAERYVIDMCAAAARREMTAHVHWIAPAGGHDHRGAHRMLEAARRNGASVSGDPSGTLRQLWSVLRENQPDLVVINACGRPRLWRAPWMCRVLGIPSAWVHHMVDRLDPRGLRAAHLGGRLQGLSLWRVPQALRHRLAAWGATRVITSNEQDAAYLRCWRVAPHQKLMVIPPGIDPTMMRGQQTKPGNETFVIGTASRLVDGKGLEELIAAVDTLVREGMDLCLLIAGDGPNRGALERIVEQNNLGTRVRFVGFFQEMRSFYNALDIFVLASRSESFGLALTEAMACGLPVLATPTPGARCQIQHRRNGLLATGFTSDSLASAIRELHHGPALREKLGLHARETALDRFTIDRTLERTANALLSRLRNRPDRELSTTLREVPA